MSESSAMWYNPARYNTTHDIHGNALIRVQTKKDPEIFAKGLVLSDSFEAVKLPKEIQELFSGKFRGLVLFLAMTGFNLRPSAHPEGNNPYEQGTLFFANPGDSAVVYRRGSRAIKKEFRIQPQ